MSLKCGVVGLPNVGKSTIFRALTNSKAEIANYPFCTIDPNTGMLIVPDLRLQTLTELFKSKKTTPTTVEIVDIAGLVKGASEGEGLGNQFLSHIREVDTICHVVRCFEDPNVVHVNGKVDPLADIFVIDTELALKDLETLTKRVQKNDKLVNTDPLAKKNYPVYKKVKEGLEQGELVRHMSLTEDEALIVKDLNLLTSKPVLYVANVSESDLPEGGSYVNTVREFAKNEATEVLVISGKFECELADLPENERKEYLESMKLTISGKDRLIQEVYKALGLLTFLTAGEKEARAWTVRKGSTAPQAAGMIHSDFERGFISAEVLSFEDLKKCGSFSEAKHKGLLRLEGKTYIVQDGDVCLFRFSV